MENLRDSYHPSVWIAMLNELVSLESYFPFV